MSTRQVDLSTQKKIFWAKANRSVVDIFRKPISNFKHLPESAKTRNRQTQTTPADPVFKVFLQNEKWSLVQLFDGTFGWLINSEIKRVKDLNYWEKIKLAPHEKLIKIVFPSNQKIRNSLSKFKDIPYLWGGTTKHGMDCSAFVQKFLLKISGILLPRNSHEQKKCGQSVYSLSTRHINLSTRCLLDNSICPLDIFFFVHSTTSRHHVGIYFDNLIWHFCLEKKGLTSEPYESIKKRYNHVATRRIFKFKNAQPN